MIYIILLMALANVANAQDRVEIFDLSKTPGRQRVGPGSFTRESARIPSQFYNWDLSSGMIGRKSLNSNLTVDKVRKILEPYGSFKTEGSDLLFTFSDGGNIKISHQDERVTNLNLIYNNYPREEVVRAKFINLLNTSSARAAVWKLNPYYDDEVTVRNRFTSAKASANYERANICEMFSSLSGVNFLPDQHGDQARYDFVLDTLALKRVDWFGIEMIPHTLQGEVNDFINQPESSDKYKTARGKLVEYFTKNWNDKFKNGEENGAQNPYFKLLETARDRKIQVYAMDVEPDYYTTNPQMDPLVVGTRNLVWAKQLPIDRSGLVFGGVEHFTSPSKATVQDFYSQRATGQPLTMMESGASCSLSLEQQSECRSDLTKLSSERKCENKAEFRCLRRNTAFVSSTCSAALGIRGQNTGDAKTPAVK